MAVYVLCRQWTGTSSLRVLPLRGHRLFDRTGSLATGNVADPLYEPLVTEPVPPFEIVGPGTAFTP